MTPGPAAGAAWSGSGDLTFPDHVPTVAGLLRHAVTHHPDSLAVATPDEQLTYAELDRRSAALAAHLVTLGVGKGSHVGTLLPNGAGWVVAWAAITRIGSRCGRAGRCPGQGQTAGQGSAHAPHSAAAAAGTARFGACDSRWPPNIAT